MPKIKTHKGAARRYGITGSGKLVRMKRHSSHLRRKKPKNVRNQFDAKLPVSETQRRRILVLIPAFAKKAA
ncbi:MAG: 50S ribosomal protein L35 [Dehalococcoidia bacterium]